MIYILSWWNRTLRLIPFRSHLKHSWFMLSCSSSYLGYSYNNTPMNIFTWKYCFIISLVVPICFSFFLFFAQVFVVIFSFFCCFLELNDRQFNFSSDLNQKRYRCQDFILLCSSKCGDHFDEKWSFYKIDQISYCFLNQKNIFFFFVRSELIQLYFYESIQSKCVRGNFLDVYYKTRSIQLKESEKKESFSFTILCKYIHVTCIQIYTTCFLV